MNTDKFDYSLDFKQINFRERPDLYRVGVGEQGVLLVEPYKSEILPNWRFRTEDIAKDSAKKIYAQFKNYLAKKDFVGADMARKFLQMGFTRARRYANYQGGKKYKQENEVIRNEYPYSSGSRFKGNELNERLENNQTSEKAKAANVFKMYWTMAKTNRDYICQQRYFKKKYYQHPIEIGEECMENQKGQLQ